ncbi:MAG TPA: adenosine deaminase [Dehalococcoidales bacterium]
MELHLHLEGAIPLDTLWELIRKYGGEPSVPNRQALTSKFQYRDFPHFIQTWIWKNQFLREYEDFILIAEATARDLAAQNIRYAETFFTPSDFFGKGLKTQKITEAIRVGLARVPEIQIELIADFCRDDGVENAAKVIEEINEVKGLGVIGVTIGGSEQSFPPEPFAGVYARARQLGFHTSAHAGEAAGPESIWGAIQSLKVERIGHGTRAIEDEQLLEYLAEKKIPLEVCPLSNVRTGVVKSIDTHPVRKFFERGIVVTINTDDPKMFGNSLAEEYRLLEERLGFSRDDIRTLILQAIDSAWLPEAEKRQTAEQFKMDESWNETCPLSGD